MARKPRETPQPETSLEPAAVWCHIDQLVPWADNPRLNDQAVGDVADSIKRFGFASPIVARREDNMVIAGHTRLKAARALGLDRVPVRFVDLDPADAKLLALRDNKSGEIAEWDEVKVGAILAELKAEEAAVGQSGFSDDEIAGMIERAGIPQEEPDAMAEGANSELIPEKWQVAVDCESELDQVAFLERMESEGRKCRALIS